MTLDPLEIERALTLGENHVVGRYRYDLASQAWWWSAESYEIHGFAPGEVVPTTALVLAHKHPEDRARVSRVLGSAALTGEPFSSLHRIMDARGRERTVTVVGQGRRDPATHVVRELVGYFVDVTEAIKSRAAAAASASIRAASRTGAIIEQAKGIIAFALPVDADGAFELMRKTSNDTNVAVRDIACRIVELTRAAKCSTVDVASALKQPG